MPLGSAKWARHRPFYDALTLADGDEVEQRAGSEYGLGTSFSWYLRFWKFHVAPATNRPHNIGLRWRLTSAIISSIVQRSHGVIDDLVKALDDYEAVKAGDLGRNE